MVIVERMAAREVSRRLASKILGISAATRRPATCVWLHAVSVGEVNLLQTLLERLERDYPIGIL